MPSDSGIPESAAAIANAAANFIGMQQTNAMNRKIAEQANFTSANMAKDQMNFQREMASTQWQRTVEDMRKAGINPMLAVSQGTNASPMGAMGQVTTGAPMQNALGAGAHGALSALRLKAEIENLHDTNANIRSQTQANVATARKTNADAQLSENAAAKSGVLSSIWHAPSALTQMIRDRFNAIHNTDGSIKGSK